jgi:hypothetical protein
MDRDETLGVHGEPFADWPLALVAMVGGVGGALIGATTAANAGAAFPLTLGTLVAMLGSGVCALVWCLLDDRLSVRAAQSYTRFS